MMIAYLDDFKLMMFVALLAVPMLLLLRNPRRSARLGQPRGLHPGLWLKS
jgi:hypothetical protein